MAARLDAFGHVNVPEAFAGIGTAIVGALALRRTGYRLSILVGAVLAAIGMFGLALGPRGGLSAFAWLAGAAALVGVGSGWADPASRNAGLQLLPEESASLAALRTMSRRAGTVAAISVMTAAIAQSTSPGNAHAIAIAGFGVLLLACAPIAARIPEHRGAW